ncbi:MAG TPA: ATP-binding cassette domain-containing protein, partial [Armatimonadota bacterium]|nr:ATP-binding cassette domain-containing protein [Armatimonadota bacterium]
GRDLYAMGGGQRGRLRATGIGFVFQMFHLVPYLSALENVLVTNLAGAGASRQQVAELLGHLGLGDRLAHLPAELSAGERQRVALARALIKHPEIILADEPTGNLDPDSAAQVMGHLGRFHEGGGTVVVVSHDPAVEQHSDRALRLQAGRLLGA